MTEVLAKAEKYINGEEALMSKKGKLFRVKGEKQGLEKAGPNPQETKRQRQISTEGQRRQRSISKEKR